MDNITQTDQLFQQFLSFEGENKLLEKYRIDGVPLWANCRFAIFLDLLNAKGFIGRDMGVSAGKAELIKRQLRRAQAMIRSGKLFRHPGKFPKAVDVLLVNQPRKVLFDGRYGCKYSYLWAEFSQLNVATIEPPLLFGDNPHLEPSHFEASTYYTDRLLFAGKWHEIKGSQIKNPEAVKQSKEIAVHLCSAFGVPEKEDYYTRFIYKRFLYYRYFRDYWKKFLDDKRPGSVVVVNAYSSENMPLVQAANEMGIKTIEIQHGTMGRRHIAYNYSPGEYIFFPKYLLVWGAFWRDTTRLPIPSENCFVTGFPFLEKNIGGVQHEKQYDVLFISQITIGEQMLGYAKALAESHPEWSMVYKLHPSEVSKVQEWQEYFRGTGIKLEYKSDLYTELRKAKVVVGVYSTSLFEALAFGLRPIILTDLYGAGHMDELIAKGGAIGVKNGEELAVAVAEELRQNQEIVDLSYFFASHSLENIEEAVSQILQSDLD